MSQIQGKWIEPGAITPSLLDATAAYTMGSLSVSGDSTVGGDLRIDGTATVGYIRSEVLAYDRLQIDQTDNQEALVVRQTGVTATVEVVRVENAGSGASMIVNPGTSSKGLGIGITPTQPLDVNGVALFRSDATVNGGFRVDGTMSAGVISSEVMVYDQLQVSQNDDQEALIVRQTNAAATATNTRIINDGTGAALTVEGTTPTVAIGATSVTAGQTLDVNGKVRIADTLTCVKDATVSGGISTNQATTGALTVTADAGVGNDLTVGRDLQVTRDATVGAFLLVSGSAEVDGPLFYVLQDATVGSTLNAGLKVVSADATFSSKVGIGNRLGVMTITGPNSLNPETKLHVRESTGYGGAIGPHADTQVMIDNAGNAGLQILTPNASSGVIYFGDTNGNQQGRVIYANSNDTLSLYSGGLIGAAFDSTSRMSVGTVVTNIGTYAQGDADDLVVGNPNGPRGITIASAPANVGTLAFSDGVLQNKGRIEYDHNAEAMKLYADGTAAVLVEINDITTGRPVVGIGLTDPQTYSNNSLNELVVGSNVGNHGITIVTDPVGVGALVFSNGSNVTDVVRGRIQYSHSTDSISFFTDATQRAVLKSSSYGLNTVQMGVGTASPGAVVHAYTDNTGNGVAILGETNVAGSTAVRGLLADASTGNVFEGYRGATRVFRVDSQGEVFGSAYHTVSPADFAEWCIVEGDLDDYPVGTVVQQSDKALTVETASNLESIYGVVTDRAAFCGGLTNENVGDNLTPEQIEHEFGAKRIAMVGHVQVRVVGLVKLGQRLTISTTPGIARAAATANEKIYSFAIARTTFTPDDGDEIGLVEVRLL